MPYQISRGYSARRCFAIAALAMTVLSPVATALAAAPDADALPQVAVTFADLDLASDAGATLLLRRIEAAARQVCGDPRELQPMARSMRVRQCNAQAIERAVTKVGAPKVTLAYRARYTATRMG
jgi:UrcA family protein